MLAFFRTSSWQSPNNSAGEGLLSGMCSLPSSILDSQFFLVRECLGGHKSAVLTFLNCKREFCHCQAKKLSCTSVQETLPYFREKWKYIFDKHFCQKFLTPGSRALLSTQANLPGKPTVARSKTLTNGQPKSQERPGASLVLGANHAFNNSLV